MLKPGIAGIGCALIDILHPDVDFSSSNFKRFESRVSGDGGLVPGQLVFASALESFSKESTDHIIELLSSKVAPSYNLGGPAIVASVLAAQLLQEEKLEVRYFGWRGDDHLSDLLEKIVLRTPLPISDYQKRPGKTPATRVLSDPEARNGSGERLFINSLGVAEKIQVDNIPDEFFDYRIAFFGGTALLPSLHSKLGEALQLAKSRGALTVVGTVYDFWNETKNPSKLWPLGNEQHDYQFIDLIVTDAEEAFRLTGTNNAEDAIDSFLDWGAGAAIVTAGEQPVTYASRQQSPFGEVSLETLPVSNSVLELNDSMDQSLRDTTGCGDNFMGGVLASIARQSEMENSGAMNLKAAVIEGIAAGAAAWFQLGGTFLEHKPGAALERQNKFRNDFMKQLGDWSHAHE